MSSPDNPPAPPLFPCPQCGAPRTKLEREGKADTVRLVCAACGDNKTIVVRD